MDKTNTDNTSVPAETTSSPSLVKKILEDEVSRAPRWSSGIVIDQVWTDGGDQLAFEFRRDLPEAQCLVSVDSSISEQLSAVLSEYEKEGHRSVRLALHAKDEVSIPPLFGPELGIGQTSVWEKEGSCFDATLSDPDRGIIQITVLTTDPQTDGDQDQKEESR